MTVHKLHNRPDRRQDGTGLAKFRWMHTAMRGCLHVVRAVLDQCKTIKGGLLT